MVVSAFAGDIEGSFRGGFTGINTQRAARVPVKDCDHVGADISGRTSRQTMLSWRR